MSRVLGALVLLVLSLALPSATAQAPTAQLAFMDGPAKPIESTNATVVVPLVLRLTITNVVCSSAASYRADLAGSADLGANATANASAVVLPGTPSVRFDVPAGAYGSNAAVPAGGPYVGRREVSFTVAADGLENSTLVDVRLQAAVVPSGDACRGTGAIPGAQAAFPFQVRFAATDIPEPAPGPELPVPPALVFAALAVATLILRRRGSA